MEFWIQNAPQILKNYPCWIQNARTMFKNEIQEDSWAPGWPPVVPQCHPEGPREGPGGALEGQRASKKGPVDAPRLPRGSFLAHFGSILGPKWIPKVVKKW